MLKISEAETMENGAVEIQFARPTVPTNNITTSGEDARTTIFLDAIIARLAPLPAELHDEVRAELRAHLDSLIAAHEELGATREEAIDAAIRQFGDAKRIACRYRR